MPGIKAKRKQLVRKTLMRAKAQGERTAEQRQESPEEYAQTEVQQGISDVAARTGNTAKSTARMSYRKFRAMQEKRKNLTLQGSTQSASKPTEKEKVTVPTQTERREMFKKQRFRQKATAAKSPAPQAPVPPSATPAPSPYQAQMQQHLKRQHLTREAVRRYTAPQLCHRLLDDMAITVLLQTKRNHNFTNMDKDEAARVRAAWKPVIEKLPDYAYLCDEILREAQENEEENGIDLQ